VCALEKGMRSYKQDNFFASRPNVNYQPIKDARSDVLYLPSM
jgi:hypothetical protein